MNTPSHSDYVLGHRSAGPLFFVAGIYSLYLAATGQVSWLVALFVILLGGAARKARLKVTRYRQWRGAWNTMAGVAPQERRNAKRPYQRAFNLVACTLAWALTGGWLLTNPQGDGTSRYAVFGTMFAFLTVWGAGVAALSVANRMLRYGGPRRRPGVPCGRGPQEDIVTVCPPIPWRPSRRQGTAALPAYAVALLARRDDAPLHSPAMPENSPSAPK
jgi:hypothetical protein